MDRLLPIVDELSRPYWEGARDHRLVMQRCPECRYWAHPPRPVCPKCRSETMLYEQASGRGKVYAWSVMHTRGNPGFDQRIPYATATIELAEQPHLFTIGNIDCPLGDIEIGMPVEVWYEPLTDEISLPQWRPAK